MPRHRLGVARVGFPRTTTQEARTDRLAPLRRRHADKIEEAWQEDSDSFWVKLKPGWESDEGTLYVHGESVEGLERQLSLVSARDMREEQSSNRDVDRAVAFVESQPEVPGWSGDVAIATIPFDARLPHRSHPDRGSYPIQSVPVAELLATQHVVGRESVLYLLRHGWDEPILVSRKEGRWAIEDAHHRAYAASLLGERSILARVAPPPVSQARVQETSLGAREGDVVYARDGLAVELRGAFRKQYVVVHEASGLPVGPGGFKTSGAAKRALNSIASITDWRQPVDELNREDLARAAEILSTLVQ